LCPLTRINIGQGESWVSHLLEETLIAADTEQYSDTKLSINIIFVVIHLLCHKGYKCE